MTKVPVHERTVFGLYKSHVCSCFGDHSEIHLKPVSGVPIFYLILQSLLEFSNVFLDE